MPVRMTRPDAIRLTGWLVLLLGAAGIAVLTFVAVPVADGTEPDEPESRRFQVTAYCIDGTTASGEETRPGIAAADPDVLPLGSVVEIDSFEGQLARYNGVYEIKDTGPKVRGHTLDLYMPSCREANRFGRRRTDVTILELAD